MANGNSTPSRPGQDNLGGSALALFLKVFGGEVIAQFKELNVMAPLLTNRSISKGKSAKFPVLGRASAFFHTAGTNILDSGNSLLSQIAGSERVINIDNRLISAVLIDDLDEAMSEFEVRGPYATELAEALAKRVDQLLLHVTILAARASSTITGLNGGTIVSDPDMKVSGVALANALFAAAQAMDEKNVPKAGRYAVISPAMHYNLIRDPAVSIAATSPTVTQATVGYPLLNSSLSPGNGNYAAATVHMCATFTLVVSNHIPSTNIASNDEFFGTSAASANGNVYYGDFSETAGVCFHSSAVGRLTMKAMGVESERKMEYQGWATIAKLAQGAGILRPEASVELSIAA